MHLFFAQTAAQSPNLFQALGLDVALLIEQAIAFLILVAILNKWVYPVLVKSIDERRRAIEAGQEEAKRAQELLAETESKVADMMKSARTEADEILARTHQEAAAQVAEAENKAKSRAEQIVKDAHGQLEADIARARQTLKRDTIQLVAMATEKIIHEKVDAHKDAALIDRALASSTVSHGASGGERT